MLNRFAKASLIMTTFAPVLLTFAFVEFTNEGLSGAVLILLGVAVLLVLICVGIMSAAMRVLERIRFAVTSVRIADTETVGYVLAYLLPLVNIGPESISLEVLAFVLLVFLLVAWTGNSHHFNPLLGMVGFHFYEVTTDSNVTFVLITRRDIRTSKGVTEVVQLTPYTVLDVK